MPPADGKIMVSNGRLDSRAKIMTFVILPDVFTAFIFVTLTQDRLVSSIFAAGVAVLLVIEILPAH